MTVSREAEYHFAPHERPLMPGSPFMPAHPTWRRSVYVGVALLTSITATLGYALVSVNVTNIAGSLGEYMTLISLLPAIHVAMNASANLLLIKGRIQFGIPSIARVLLTLYAIAGLSQFVFPGFAAAALIRVVSGITAAYLTTMTVYYLLQVFPIKIRPASQVIGIGFIQLGTPLARLFPVEMLAQHDWRNLHLIELALPLATLAAITLFPLPPNERAKAFGPIDFVTIVLFMPGMLLFCAVLAEGRLFWWADAPWIGWALVAAVPLLAAAILIETHRVQPLLDVQWIGTAGILRFAVVALLMRIVLAEQTYGSVGLLTFGGLTNDQLHTLFAIVLGAMLLGIVVAVLTLKVERLRYQVMIAALILGFAAWSDGHVTNLTRPHELYLSQAMIGFGTTLFIGPALLTGLQQMFARGPTVMVSFIVLFSMTQNVGGLIGSSLLGSYQYIATQAHAGALSEQLVLQDPQVVERIAVGARSLAGTVTDPGADTAQGVGLLAQAMTREATILAFNDVFQFVAVLAFGAALYVFYLILLDLWRRRRKAQAEAHA